MPIEALTPGATYTAPTDTYESAVSRSSESQQSGFAEAMGAVIREANQAQIDARTKALDLAVNGKGTIHDAMVALDNAEGSFRLLMEMRNRLVEGVNRLLETQV